MTTATFYLVTAVVFLAYLTALFVYHNITKKADNIELTLGTILCLFCAFMWPITLPAVILTAISWFTAKLLTKLILKKP